MHTNWQVCSLVAQAKSQNIAAIRTQLNTLPGCEVALSDVESGQLIVVVEADQGRSADASH
ncbi:napAB assembly protein [Salmonella bongori]|nr:napAB assembly protein [Salmonella bongori]